ncbi:MAG: GH3 auxin-responsive promoter family protein [Deltaproteobacteria bacterium]|nr:GH3 auxin-responsive promoter family protein [Deltaproteobacteria bacterium]
MIQKMFKGFNFVFNHGFKFFAKNRVKYLNQIDPIKAQASTLKKILSLARSCKFFKDHGLSEKMTVEDYQKCVPLRTYEDFWNEYMKSSFPVVSDLIWPGTINYFSWTSGTTSGARKYIPYNQLLKSNYTWAGIDLLAFHFANKENSALFTGKFLSLTSNESFEEIAPKIFLGEISGFSTKGIPFPFTLFKFPPSSITKIKDWAKRVEEIVKAIGNENITGIGGMPSWLLVFFEQLGLAKGVEEGFLSRLFPNLQLLVHGGVNFTPYHDRFRKFCEGLNVDFREIYPASEGFIAVADREFGDGLRLLCNHLLFFEFVPAEELNSKNPTRKWLANVEKGVNYAVVLTNPAGFWSYVLGDTVRFVELNPPRILITGRTKFSLSAFGEHLIGEELENAVTYASDCLGFSVVDYTVFPEFISDVPGIVGRHVFLIEIAEENYINEEEVSRHLDEKLLSLNDDYKDHREPGCGLAPPKVILAPRGFFANWMKNQNKLGDQFKVPRVLTSEQGKNILAHLNKSQMVDIK